MKKFLALINIFLCLILTSCVSTEKKAKLENINILEERITIIVGETKEIEYQIIPSNVEDEFSWTIEDPDVASIDDGVLTGLKKGETTVTISSDLVPTIKDTVEVEVVNKIFTIDYSIEDGYFETKVPRTFEYTVGLDTLPIPKRDGYIFLGWYLNDELVTSISPSVDTDIVLLSKWEKVIPTPPKTYYITYELDGGAFLDIVENEYTENVGLESLPIPKKENYVFLGWYLNDELVTNISPNLNQDITIVAKWELSLDYEKANYIIDLINTLPYNTTYNDKEKIYNTLEYYSELNDDTKLLVNNIDILNEKIEIIEDIENDLSNITYVLGNNVYLSKEELFINFFSDFYKFIVNEYGDAYLIENNINSVEDFVNLACDFNGAGASNLYGIGNLAGRYLLTKDVNGILENQPETTFFGYCYKNELYVDLLPFFIRFFAYWRIDEGYANENNYGADIFAEGWAPTVDIAKFFYYNENTSYVKTDRMIDCLINTSSVVYGELPTQPIKGLELPTNLKLRGYKFIGWYDNKEFNGDPITRIDDVSKKIILYAKWEIDEVQFEKDKAEIVDIYIYNLTTSKAVVNKQNVQYIRDMYEELTNIGKTYVENYNTLIEFEEKYAEYFLNPITVNIKISLDKEIELEDIRNDFIRDFNSTTNSNIESIDELISGKYTYMKKIGQFYNNNFMSGKWLFLLDLLYEENCYNGLKIQIDRIKNNNSGDLEYVTNAIAYLLNGADATSDKEVLVDYSSEEKINSIVNSFGNYQITFEKESYLPVTNLNDYEFIGYFDENNNIVTKVTENMATDLVAKYEKK